MALSGSTDFSLNRDEIIIDAFAIIGVGVDGETLTTANTNKASRALNMMIKSWVGDGMALWVRKTASITLVTSTQSYTVGPTGDKVIDRPYKITQAWRQDSSNNDSPIELLAMDSYNLLSSKTNEGTPTQIFYDRTLTDGTIYVWPVPDATAASEYTLEIEYQKPYDDMDSAADDFEFQQEWYLALLYGLSSILSDYMGLPLAERGFIARKAQMYKEDALSTIVEDESTFFTFDTTRNGYYGNDM